MKIYCITNSINGKQYVGQTTQSIAARWRGHCSLQGRCRAIENAIRKYGVKAFSIRKMVSAESQAELDRLERFWIEKLGTVSPNGYNLSGGGGGAGRMHGETKAIMRKIGLSPERIAQLNVMRKRPDVLSKYADATRKNWADPKFKKMTSSAIKSALNKPSIKAKHIAALDQARNRPEYKANLAAAMAEVHARPAVKEKLRLAMVTQWNAPGERIRRGEVIRQALAKRTGPRKPATLSDEERERRRELMRERWKNPEFRAKVAKTMADRDMIERRSAAIKKVFESPELRKKRGEAISAGKKRKRELRAA